MTNKLRLAVAFVTTIAIAILVAALVVERLPFTSRLFVFFSNDVYVPTESSVFNTAPELRIPRMIFTGVWGDMDMSAEIFQFEPTETASEDAWSQWINGLEATSWTVVRWDHDSVHLRRIEDVRFSRWIGEIRAQRTTSGRIVVSVVNRPVAKKSTSLAESQVGDWLEESFLPRFNAAVRDAETKQQNFSQ